MRRRWLIFGLGVAALLVSGPFIFRASREPPPSPRYLQLRPGMSWEQAEEVMGKPPYGTFLQDSTLRKVFTDVDGRVWVTYDGDDVTSVEFIPDNPNPSLFEQLARWLRL